MASKNSTTSKSSTGASTTQVPAAPASTVTAPTTPPLSAAALAPTPLAPLPAPALPPPNAALVSYVAQAMAQIDSAEAALAVDPPALTPSQKRRAGKLRSGGDKAVGQIAMLAKQYGVESSVLQADAMSLALADAQAVAPLIVRVQAFEKHVSDLLFLWQSSAWSDAMQFYALLQRRALVDGSLAASLAPVAAFFAKRHASTKPAGQPPKRTAQANAKAVKRLKKAAPQLLANGGEAPATALAPTPAASTAAAATPQPTAAAASAGTTNGAGAVGHS